ncbi:hypothetical protein TNIN_42751 [Trichonephila inaurata madagascariensis]|uniref:Uncharacterized protein n=1 Tax=Trichonephila inaurata madagascariensis TaxID=2747483 RepID=A0A8X7BRR9_9ARAC|nr:hypothetical protein TNIN_42751 [Trichonephila inaurata madagascariensis]
MQLIKVNLDSSLDSSLLHSSTHLKYNFEVTPTMGLTAVGSAVRREVGFCNQRLMGCSSTMETKQIYFLMDGIYRLIDY